MTIEPKHSPATGEPNSPEADSQITNPIQPDTVDALDPKLVTFISQLHEAVAEAPFAAEGDESSLEAIRRATPERSPVESTNTFLQPEKFGSKGTVAQPTDYVVPAGLPFLSPPQRADEIGRLNGYRILRKLGEGGMGMVFEAEDIRLERRVALKVMKPEVASNAVHSERFLREARTAAKVEHDHICPIYQVGEENAVPFIAMPFLKGEPMDVKIRREKPLEFSETFRLGREIAEGLEAAHQAGLIHRDIKPANIWLEAVPNRQSRVRILDFGLARTQTDEAHLTVTGAVMGTPAYMSPEQARGRGIDSRSDLFSLGVILYEMTTGKRPFTGSDTMSILTSLAIDEPPSPMEVNPAVPNELSELIMRLLSKSADKRPSTARKVADELLRIQFQATMPVIEPFPLPVQARAPLPPPKPIRRPADPWENIDDVTENVAVPVAKAVSETKTPRKTSDRSPWIAVLLAGLLVTILGGFAAYKIIYQSKDGTLVVEVESEADVRFRNGNLEIYDEAGKLKYTLAPSEKNATLPAGKYLVKVTGADGVKLETDRFELSRNGTVTLRVTAETTLAKKEPKLDLTKTPDRKAAEYILSIGGTIGIIEKGIERHIRAIADLPRGNFELISVEQPNQKFNDAGLANFRDCKHLKRLDLTSTEVSDAGLANFADCRNLEWLLLGSTKVTDAGLAHFKDCKNLTNLNLNETKVTDAGLAHFRDLSNLVDLSLALTKVSDAGLAQFRDLSNLLDLSLAVTKVSDAGLARFTGSGNLRNLRLDSTATGDVGLAHFKLCRELGYVDLDSTAITDAAITQISEWKKLRLLLLTRTKVTAKGIETLRKVLPQCRIQWDGGVVEPAMLKDAEKPFVLLRADKRIGEFKTFAEIWNEHKADDIIEVHSNATLLLPAIAVDVRGLHLKAGRGFRPKFVGPADLAAGQTWISVFEAPLSLDGCDFEVPPGEHVGISGTGTWEIRNCRMSIPDGFNPHLLSFHGKKLDVSDSLLVGDFSHGMISLASSVEAVFTNTLFSSAAYSAIALTPKGGQSLRLESCSFSGYSSALIIGGSEVVEKCQVVATRCAFDAGVIITTNPREKLKQILNWQGTGNLYRTSQILLGGGTMNAISKLDEWKDFWGDSEKNPREAAGGLFPHVLRSLPLAEILPTLATWKFPAEPKAGPDFSIIGPGEGYQKALATDGKPVAKEQLRPEPLPEGGIILLREGKVVRGYLDINIAVADAKEGDVLELRTEKLETLNRRNLNEGKKLTIRSAPGYRPAFSGTVALSPTDEWTLEGLHFGRGIWIDAGRLVNCSGDSIDGILLGGEITRPGKTLEVIRCLLPELTIEVKETGRVRIENSAIGRIVIQQAQGENTTTLTVEKSLLWSRGSAAICLFIIGKHTANVKVQESVLLPRILHPEGDCKVLWSGDRNVYLSGFQVYSWVWGKDAVHLWNLAAWQKRWGSDAASVEGMLPIFDVNLWRLRKEIAVPDVGADVQRIGIR